MIETLLSPLLIAPTIWLIILLHHRIRCSKSVHFLHALLVLNILLMTPLGANGLVYIIETAPYSTAHGCADGHDKTLVLLTGGLDRQAVDTSDYSALSNASLQRLFGLWRSGLVSRAEHVVISGGGQYQIAESQLLGSFAVRLGIRPEQLALEDRSHSTWENASESSRLLMKNKSITLVTSALHMPRAMLAFEHHGFKVCPLKVDSMYLPPSGIGYLLPQSSALKKTELAIHEVLGWLSYRLR